MLAKMPLILFHTYMHVITNSAVECKVLVFILFYLYQILDVNQCSPCLNIFQNVVSSIVSFSINFYIRALHKTEFNLLI